ncbi:MAG: hypothetical protein H6Q73_1490 [Firmicutes bacterium]|nr:hypothetical protein [Bacillota bacterium]
MTVDWKRMGVTKRTWGLLVILVLVVIGYYFLGVTNSPPMAPVVVGKPANKAGEQAASAKLKAAGLLPAAPVAANRDPFEVPPVYRQVDKESMTETVGTKPEVAAEINTKPATMPLLQGTVLGRSSSVAILTLGAESRAVRVGQAIGDYTLVAVEADSAVVEGPGGAITLWMRRQE